MAQGTSGLLSPFKKGIKFVKDLCSSDNKTKFLFQACQKEGRGVKEGWLFFLIIFGMITYFLVIPIVNHADKLEITDLHSQVTSNSTVALTYKPLFDGLSQKDTNLK